MVCQWIGLHPHAYMLPTPHTTPCYIYTFRGPTLATTSSSRIVWVKDVIVAWPVQEMNAAAAFCVRNAVNCRFVARSLYVHKWL